MKKSLPLRLLLTFKNTEPSTLSPLRLLLNFKNTEPSTLSLKSFRKGGGGGELRP